MSQHQNRIDPLLQQVMDSLQPLPERDPQKAARGRAKFLQEVVWLSPTVSNAERKRHKGWIHLLTRKEPIKMSTLATLFLILSVALSGTGATVYAAQASQPEGVLYQIKLASEDLANQFAFKTQTKLAMTLGFANRRMEELGKVLASDELDPEFTAPGGTLEASLNRWQKLVQNAFQMTEGMDEGEFTQAMTQIRTNLRLQERLMNQAQVCAECEPLQETIRLMIRDRIRIAETGLEEPLRVRDWIRTRQSFEGSGPLFEAGQASPEAGPGPGTCLEADPTCGANGSSYGPGSPEYQDQDGYGPGGGGEQSGPGPNEDEQKGYGPGSPGYQTQDGNGPGGDEHKDGTGPGTADGSGSGNGYTGGDETGGANSGSGDTGGNETGGDQSGNGYYGNDSPGGDSSGSDQGGGKGSGGGGKGG